MADHPLDQLITEWLLARNTAAEAKPLLRIRKYPQAEQRAALLYALGQLNDHQRAVIAFLHHIEAGAA